jgi:hypothetical protein
LAKQSQPENRNEFDEHEREFREAGGMNARKKLRQLIAAPGLRVLPGAYDALSARIIAREGFDAIMAGGYAANGSLLAQADMGQSNMREHGDHRVERAGGLEGYDRGAMTP